MIFFNLNFFDFEENCFLRFFKIFWYFLIFFFSSIFANFLFSGCFMDFLNFFRFFWIFFLIFFWIFFWICWTFFLDFWICWNFFDFLQFFWDFFWLFGIHLKITKVTTKRYQGYYWTPTNAKMGQNSMISSFFAQRAKKASAKGQSPP